MADYDSSLPVRTEADGDVVSKIVDDTGANIWLIDANGIGQVNLNNGTNSLVIDANGNAGMTLFDSAGDQIEINTSGSLLIGDSTADWTFNANGAGKVTIEDDAGDQLGVNADGSINVIVQEEGVSATEVHEYTTSTAIAPNTPTTVVDYTVSASTTLRLKSWKISCSGKAKGSLQVGPAASEVEVDVSFVSTSDGSYETHFDSPIEVAAGDKVLVVMENRDKANADLYAWINGNEIPV